MNGLLNFLRRFKPSNSLPSSHHPWAALIWVEPGHALTVNHYLAYFRFFPTREKAEHALSRNRLNGRREIYPTIYAPEFHATG